MISVFDMPITINSDWGVRNLREAAENPISLSDLGKGSQMEFTLASKDDMKRITRKMLSRKK